ncbi:MAG: hypothetical protein JSU85_15585 [Candidatus Zixiibacteriota bacterium]|nr:MAG: hypothetical protein JSU85_15585 [candidate division Zixibacteria bacterium]
MTFWDKLMNIDRRWVYLCIGIVVIIPAIIPFKVPVSTTLEVERIYDFVESCEAGDYIYLGIDYDPSTLAELDPMTYAILNHAFSKDVNVITACLSQFGPAMAELRLTEVAQQYGKESGKDYCFLGYRPYPAITILSMGLDFQVTFPLDYYGVPVDSLEIMQGIRNLQDVKGVISLTAGNVADFWITYGNGRFGFPLALGVTGVMGADYYQYLQSGQIFGLIPGIKGAAEYEVLSGFETTGLRSIPYQTLSHGVILLFIIISNIGYFASKRKKRT